MPFAYERSTVGADLQQGDILYKSPALKALVGSVHTSYLKSDYLHFMVLTQSCDLARRHGIADVEYVELCAIRPVNIVIDRYAKTYCRSILLKAANANSDKDRSRIVEFTKSLLNNNNHEYFFIEEDLTLGLIASCAFLRLSVPLRLRPHYDMLVSARIACLKPDFRAKLGWSIGDIYSRVGTDDYTESVPKAALQRKVKDLLEQSVVFLEEERLKLASQSIDPFIAGLSSPEWVRTAIKGISLKSKRELLIDYFVGQMEKNNYVSDVDARKARAAFKNDPALTALI